MNDHNQSKRIGEKINAYLISLPRTTTLVVLLATASILATLSVVFIFKHSWGTLTVGSITAPVGIDRLNDDAATGDRMRVFQLREQDQQLLDSLETSRFEEIDIYSKPYNSNSNGNK